MSLSHHRYSQVIGIPRANGFNGLLRALPGEPGFFATIACQTLDKLDISVGISGPHDFAVRESARSSVARAASIASRTQRP